MRLAIVRRRFASAGGAERFIANTSQGLAAAGIDVTLVSEDVGTTAAPDQAWLRLKRAHGGRARRYRKFQKAAGRALRGGGFDLVQSHERILEADIFRAGDGVHAAWLERLARERAAWRRPLLALDAFHELLTKTERRMARDTDMVFVANSRMVAREIADWLAVPAHRLRVIENGVDLAHFRPPEAGGKAAARAALGLDPEAPLVAFVGSGFERKGAFALVEALALPALAGVHLAIAGRDKRARRLARLVRRRGLGGRVRLLGAMADVRPVLHAADMLALPTLYDPMPNAAIEAIACGLPVVTTADAGVGELVVRYGAGAVASRAADDLAAALAAVLASLADRRVGAAALRGRFDLGRTTRLWLDLYRELA
ncbi:glycosyltransferase family 4 protein [Aquibium sp. A9E412]|uniref:glycosyltransferase family 4 protein n=1 Tax=Aquibium sp. A9E412 TaxID=2976767 RepID=UPI0025B0BB98|nr:glycosyltransferase family 4 protein [Aquibium sp. A9E412]MDN2565461.1 glycosyltransferase family 4 protein [Aquibium sp. A9E412]